MTSTSPVDLPEVIRVQGPVHCVGRGDNADIRLAHPAISRRHAELRWDGKEIVIRDLGSQTGVRVNGIGISKAALKQDDVVSFGPVAFELKGQLLRRLAFDKGIQVQTEGLFVQRGNDTILSNIALTIPANNFVGIIGPSGAGKTTLLKSLSGSLPSLRGQVVLDGQELTNNLEYLRSMMGFVPQEDVVYPTLTAREPRLRFAIAGCRRLASSGAIRLG